jgi:hypothetical protein
MLRSYSLHEKYFLGIVIAVLLLVISLPYLWALAITPPGFQYSGLLYNPDDQNVHLAWERQAQQGHLAIRDLFTTESLQSSDKPLFINLYTLAVGTVSRVTHIPLIWVTHFFRLLFAALAMLWFYDLCRQLTASRRTRYLAVLFAAFSTGVGWLLPILPGHIFMDRPDLANFPMMPEAYIFTSAFIFGLNIASLALMVLVYGQLLRAEEKQSWKHAAIAAAAAFVLANIHTYDAFPMIGVLVIWFVYKLWQCKSTFIQVPLFKGGFRGISNVRNGGKLLIKPVNPEENPPKSPFEKGDLPRSYNKSTFNLAAAGTIIIAAILPMIYQWIVFQNDMQFRLKAVTYTAAPLILDVLMSYGLVFILAVIGIICICRKRDESRRAFLLPAWIGITLLAIYVPRWLGHPLSFERKMIEGMHWPLCLLAAVGLVWILERLNYSAVQKAIAGIVIIINCISSFQFVGWCLGNAQDNNRSRANVLMPPLYISDGDQAAMQYLKLQGDQTKAVLCLTFIGNYIPGQTGMTAYLGHWAETIDYQNKLSETLKFYTLKMTRKEARDWLEKNHIGYVLMGSYEHQLGAVLPLPLKQVFDKDGAVIYKVE